MKDMYDRIRVDFPKLRLEEKTQVATFGVICSGFDISILRLDLPFKQVYRVSTIFQAALPRREAELSRYKEIIQKVFELQRAVLKVAQLLQTHQTDPGDNNNEGE